MSLWFLAAAAAMTAAAMAFVLSTLRLRGRAGKDRTIAPQAAAQVLCDQRAELRAALAAGRVDEGEFHAAQEDLQRRALAEAAPVSPPGRTAAEAARSDRGRQPRAVLVAVALALPATAFTLYLNFGSPYLSAPQTSVPGGPGPVEAAGSLDRPSVELLAQLQAHVAAVPTDARAWILLARARMESGQFGPAAAAYRSALDSQPKVARDPQVWCEYADAVGMEQGGRLAGRPRELIERALVLDPAAACALEMAGSAAVEAGDVRAARDHWRRLLAQVPEGSPHHVQLLTALARVEQQARFALPARTGSPGPRELGRSARTLGAVEEGLPRRNNASRAD